MKEDHWVQDPQTRDLDAPGGSSGLGDLADQGDLSRWLVQASPDGLWVFDARGNTVLANARMAQMLGRTAAEMEGLSVFETLDEIGQAQFADHLAGLETTSDPGSNLECSLLRKDGERFWALVSHTPIKDDDDNHVGWLHRVTEYSQQRRLIDTLQRREAQLAEAQHIAKIGSWEWDVGSDIVSWSDELYRIYGLDPGTDFAPNYQGFLDRMHPDDREAVEAAITRALEETDEFVFDARISRKDGSLAWIRGRGRVARDETGAVARMGGTSQDITETKDAEQALALLTSMATAANEATTLAEVIPTILLDVARHTGWQPVAVWLVTADGELDLVPGETRAVPEQDIAEATRIALAAVESHHLQASLTAEGTSLVAAPVVAGDRVACVIVMDTRTNTPPTESDGLTVGRATAIFSRVAERELAAERLEQARDKAMSASMAKSEFLATMSHEIRTPLNGVIGLSELLGRTELTPHQRRLADGIDGAGRSLLSLVNDILDLSKIEAGRLDLEAVDFDPRAIVEQSTTMMAERARAKDLELAVTCHPGVPAAVSGDPVRFGQVISNLTSNAVKFTTSGEVVVRAMLETSDEADGSGAGATDQPETGATDASGAVAAAPSEQSIVLRVEVSDTGSGMSSEVQERLFTAFSQGDSSTTREYGGTGLGLAISRQIVEAMGGEIGVNSEPGSGSTFWFTARFAPATETDREQVPLPSVAGLRVLVVDDNETNRFILEEQLAGWSIEAALASSGVEGLGLLDDAHRRGLPFDVVLLDYVMPGVNGEQFARMVRGDGRFGDARIILLTSAMDLDPEVLSSAGIDVSLTKPVLPSSLLDTLANVAGDRAEAQPGADAAAGSRLDRVQIGTRGRILVVEDNEVNQMVAVGILESLGYAVDVAENGLAGYYSFQSADGSYDAVLMDCQMPQMDGYDATRMIRSFEDDQYRTPIIAMTAAAIAGERERCLESGMDDFLTKPVDVTLLRETLDRWVPADGVHGTEGDATDSRRLAARADTTVLDPSRLEELLDLDPGDPTMLLRFIDRFGPNARATLATMRDHRVAGSAHELSRAAHGLKGSAANLGATRLAELCAEVEHLGEDGIVVDQPALVAVERALDAAVRALESFAVTLRRLS